MASGIPLPALGVRDYQPESPTDQIGKLVQLRSALNQQQMQQGQLQLQQQQIRDQQAMTAAMKNWDGKDYDALSKSVLENGGSANAATQIQQHGLTIKKIVSDIAMQDAKTGQDQLATFTGKQKAIGDAISGLSQVPDEQLHQAVIGKVNDLVQGGILDQQHAQGMVQQIGQIQDPTQLRNQMQILAKTSAGAQYAAEQAKTAAQTRQENAKAGEEERTARFYDLNPAAGAPGVPAETVSLMDYMRTPAKPGEPMHTPSNFPAWKAKQEAIQTAPEKIAVAEAEGRARQLIQGMAEPGYAFDPTTGKTVLTDQTAYLQQRGQPNGLQAFRKIGEKDVRDDTMLISRLGDVHQKLTEYEQALQKSVSEKDKGNMAALLGVQGFKLGAFGTEIPMDRVNAAMNAENLSKLSANARDQLVAYKNMREAMVGYKTVLSGSSRGSDKQMELLDQALPHPAVTDPDYSKRSLDAFRGNLRVVGQGLPNLPGVKSPQEIENEVRTSPIGGSEIHYKIVNGQLVKQ